VGPVFGGDLTWEGGLKCGRLGDKFGSPNRGGNPWGGLFKSPFFFFPPKRVPPLKKDKF